MSLRCIHYIPEIRLELGGVVAAVLDLSRELATRGHRIVIATCDASDAPQLWRRNDRNVPEVVELAASSINRQWLNRDAIAKLGKLFSQFDVAHLHTPWSLGNYQLAPRLRRAGVPYVVSVHGMLDHYCVGKKSFKKRAFLRLGGRRLFRNATAIHFTADEEREQALNYIPGADRSVVIPCLVDLAPYDHLPGPAAALEAFPTIPRDGAKLLFLSRVHPKKGVDLLIQAAAELKKSRPDLQLLIAGPGDESYLAQLQQLAQRLGLAESVHFLGLVRGETKLSLYQLADVFVLPTHQENFGLVLPEAMACGAPVVTTRGTDIWRELQQGGVRIVDAEPNDIAAAIAELLQNSALRQEMSARGAAFVRQWLDRDRIASQYESMYSDAITRGVPPFAPATTAAKPSTVFR